MDTNIWLIIIGVITASFTFIILGFSIYSYISRKVLIKKYKVFYKSHFDPKYKKRGFPDGCRDIFGSFLIELEEGLVDKDEVEMKRKKGKLKNEAYSKQSSLREKK